MLVTSCSVTEVIKLHWNSCNQGPQKCWEFLEGLCFLRGLSSSAQNIQKILGNWARNFVKFMKRNYWVDYQYSVWWNQNFCILIPMIPPPPPISPTLVTSPRCWRHRSSVFPRDTQCRHDVIRINVTVLFRGSVQNVCQGLQDNLSFITSYYRKTGVSGVWSESLNGLL